MEIGYLKSAEKRIKEHLFVLNKEGAIIFEDTTILKHYGLKPCLGKKLNDFIDITRLENESTFEGFFKVKNNSTKYRFHRKKLTLSEEEVEFIYCEIFNKNFDHYKLDRQSLNLIIAGLKDWDHQICICNVHGIIQFANKFFHHDPDIIIGQQILDLTPNQYKDEIKTNFDQLIAERKPYTSRILLPTSNPDFFSEYVTESKPILNTENEVLGAIFLAREINSEKEIVSPKMNSFPDDLIENSSDIYYTIDREGYIGHVNTIGLNKMGYKYDELVGKHFLDLVKKKNQKSTEEFYRHQLSKRFWSTYVEIPLVTKQNKDLWLGQHVQIVREKDGRIRGTQAIARDITKNKIIEKKLIESELKNKSIVQAIPDLLMRVDADGSIHDVEINGHNFLGSKKNLLKKNIRNTPLEKDTIDILCEAIKNALEKRHIQVVEFLANDGKAYEGRVVKISDTDVIISVRDINSRKIYEKGIIEAKQNAEKSSKAKEEFISVLSHELRNPLNAVIGLVNLLMDSNKIENQKEHLAAIKYSSDSLLKIIKDILDFSKIEAGKVEIDNSDFELKTLLQGVSHIVNSKKNSNVTFEIDISPELPPFLYGDQLKLNQILLNLLINSAKFTHNGEIKLFLKLLKKQENELSVEFKVKDTGIGISKDKLGEVFQPFNQGNTGTERKYGGSGLGLSITKELIHLLGGKITLHSQETIGTEFTFVITLQKSKKEISNVSGLDGLSNFQEFQEVKALLVEDNKMNQLVITKYFEKWNIQLDTAENGFEAIEKVSENNYDFILMDLEMPKMNGYETTKRIRSFPGLKKQNVPIIAVTASASTIIKERVLKAGMTGFIAKPFETATLYSKIAQVVGQNLEFDSAFMTPSRQRGNYNLINLSYLNDAAAGDISFMKRMINTFIKHYPEYLEQLQYFYHKNKFAELSRIAHKYKATVNILGIKKVESLIEELEDNINNNRLLESLPDIISNISYFTKEAKIELEDVLENHL